MYARKASAGAGGSRASTPTSPLDAGSVFDDMPTYLIDVLEEMGDDAARRCFWDMGPWSDLTRVWRPLGMPSSRVTFKVTQHAIAQHVTATTIRSHCSQNLLPCYISGVVHRQSLLSATYQLHDRRHAYGTHCQGAYVTLWLP